MLQFVHMLLQMLVYIIIIDVVLSYIPQARGQKWAQYVHKVADALQKPIRDMLPKGMPLDPSPMIVILLIQMLMYIL